MVYDFKMVLLNDFENDNTTMWSIFFIHICTRFIQRYGFTVMVRRSTTGVPMDGPM